MDPPINKSSTFPRLSSLTISQQNGTITVPVNSESRNGRMISWTCVSLLWLIICVLGITNIITIYLISRKCLPQSYPIQNISVKKGTRFQIAYLNDKIIEYCSVRPPFFKSDFHNTKNLMPVLFYSNSIKNLIRIPVAKICNKMPFSFWLLSLYRPFGWIP